MRSGLEKGLAALERCRSNSRAPGRVSSSPPDPRRLSRETSPTYLGPVRRSLPPSRRQPTPHADSSFSLYACSYGLVPAHYFLFPILYPCETFVALPFSKSTLIW